LHELGRKNIELFIINLVDPSSYELVIVFVDIIFSDFKMEGVIYKDISILIEI